ncbi:replication initiator protein A [Cetobacterium sp.]|uniref:replication initiator protein A n=1 Tax=Cetobacterium sp. TaxID=2071632 RepID=UPI003F2A0BA4
MRAIKREDIENNLYYQTPKWLFDLLLEGKITPGAYCLYVLMYDRTRISLDNNWVDDEGEIYIEYSWESMRKNRKVKSNTQIKRDLEKLYELNLLQVKRQYRESNIYYLNIYSENLESETTQIVEDEKQVKLHNLSESDYTNCNSEITQIVDGIKNNSSKNNINKIMNHEEHDFFENLFKNLAVNFTTTNQKSVKKLLSNKNSTTESVKEYLLETYENMKSNPSVKNLPAAFSRKISTGKRQEEYKEKTKEKQQDSIVPESKKREVAVEPKILTQDIIAAEKQEKANLDILFNSLTKQKQYELMSKAFEIAKVESNGFEPFAKLIANTQIKYKLLREL